MKRKQIMHHFRSKAEIVCLQETHNTPDMETIWSNQWGGDTFWSHGTSSSQGTAILIKRNTEILVQKTIIDKDGRYVILQFNLGSEKFLLVNVYAPNADDPSFFMKIFEQMNEIEGKKIIIGDLNLTMDPDLDRKNSKQF